MKFRIVISNLAKIDIIEALSWYKEIAPNFCNKLLSSINNTAKSLSKNPERFQIVHNQQRAIIVKNFSYSLHYYIDYQSQSVIITGMFHHKENPEKWFKS